MSLGSFIVIIVIALSACALLIGAWRIAARRATATSIVVVVVVIVTTATATTRRRRRRSTTRRTSTSEPPSHIKDTSALVLKEAEQRRTQIESSVLASGAITWALVLDRSLSLLATVRDGDGPATPALLILNGIDGYGITSVLQVRSTGTHVTRLDVVEGGLTREGSLL